MENLPKIPSPNQIVPIRDLNILKEPRGIIKPLQWATLLTVMTSASGTKVSDFNFLHLKFPRMSSSSRGSHNAASFMS
ncbi:Hypothetical predicted protein [Octopus vulgaris]|uniref:Uncharacterized protein n=1 Tax=Octopus vulgaris TaxID=6645 RepID=A0AA36ATX8_OCTVU|nr:Hypothetical predicted protein [Octopus vulgaris]